MTLYHGGKKRIGREIALAIYDVSTEIEEDENFEIKGYCEPFCGMLGVYQHIPELFENHKPKLKYKAGDTNKSVVLMWKEAQKGWIPPERCTEEHYNKLRYNGEDSAEKGFVGHQLGFAGQYFKGYAPTYGGNSNLKNASNKVVTISKKMKKTKFSYGDYTQFSDLKGYIIYCDPPYSNTYCKYKNSFDTIKFWNWCKIMAENNILFISEYKAPKGIKKVWSKSVKISGHVGIGKKDSVEKLYVI